MSVVYENAMEASWNVLTLPKEGHELNPLNGYFKDLK